MYYTWNWENSLEKSEWFSEKSILITDSDNLLNHWKSSAKNLKATLLIVDFSKTFDFIHGGKMEQILLAYSFPKETVTAIIMLYRNMKIKVHFPDEDTDFFDIVAGILGGDMNTLAPYLLKSA